jgi:hypothetical protein
MTKDVRAAGVYTPGACIGLVTNLYSGFGVLCHDFPKQLFAVAGQEGFRVHDHVLHEVFWRPWHEFGAELVQPRKGVSAKEFQTVIPGIPLVCLRERESV